MKLYSKLKDDFYNFIVGFFMGSANVIPGVSGGTMLFIMGAFNKLIDSLRAVASAETFKLLIKGEFKAVAARINLRFLCFIILGTLFSFATLAKLVVYLLNEHTMPTRAFFFGLIAASIITVNRQMKKWTIPAWVSLIISAACAFAIISLVPVNTGDAWYTMIFCGAISIVAMILAGLSGSFLLLILGQYDRVWNAVANIARFKINTDELCMIALLGAGAVAGLAAFVNLINFLMKKCENATIAALIGFMIGSLPRIWPYQHDDLSSMVMQKGKLVATRIIYDAPEFNRESPFIFLCILAGFGLVIGIEFYAKRCSKNNEK